jgi:hypothetical protein
MIGANINAYFKAAMSYPIDRLESVLRGQDKSIPSAAAMMALQIKQPQVDAMRGQQAAQQQKEPSVKEKYAAQVAELPENSGIMNLPVESQYAEGGIVAFDDGGYVPGYAAAGAVDAKIVGWQSEIAALNERLAQNPQDASAKRQLANLNALIQNRQQLLALDAPVGVAAAADKKAKKGTQVADINPVPYGEVTPQNKLQQNFNFNVPPEPAVVPVAPPVPAAPVVPAAPIVARPDASQELDANKRLAQENAQIQPRVIADNKRKTAERIKEIEREMAIVDNQLAARGENKDTLSYRTLAEKKAKLQNELGTARISLEEPIADRLKRQNAEGSKIGLGYLGAVKGVPVVPSAAAGAVDKFKDARVSNKQQQANANIPDPRAAYDQQGAGKGQQKAGSAGVGDLAKSYETISKMGPDIGAKYDTLSADATRQMEEANTAREAARPKEKAMASFEKYLEKDAEAAKGKEDRNLRMSLIAAGLGIAGGSSQFALQNIAQGAQVGVKQYNAGLDKLEDAAKERAKMQMQIEEARRSEARGD